MASVSRREFLGALGAAGVASATPLGLPIGCQTYPVREAIGKDFEGTLRELASIGFKDIELCSPQGYAKSGYGALLSMKPSEVRAKIRAAGLTCNSCHYQFREFKPESIDATIDYAKEIGLKQMVLSTFSLRNVGIAAWAQAAQDLNKAAEKIKKAGMETGFHNHNIEFEKADGEVIYDRLMKEFDPKLVRAQFQVWIISMGVDPCEVMERYPGRICSLHLQDYSPATKGMIALGKGSVDWKRFFAAARKGGVKNQYVEMDLALMRESYPFLAAMKK